jgi:hypothetical protein
MGFEQEAKRAQGLALDTFPDIPEDDNQYEYTHFNRFTLTNFQGLMFLQLGQPQDAWRVFSEVEKVTPQGLVPQRVELLSRQAATSLGLGDLEQTCAYLETATTSALALGSDLRYSENCETYLDAQAKRPHEKRLKPLAELFQQ